MSARRASEAPFPYGWPGRVCYFTVADTPHQITTRDDLRSAVADALAGSERIYATWPGEYRTDLFVIDEPELLADAIGMGRPS